MIKKYVKKPVIIEAIQFTKGQNLSTIADWLNEYGVKLGYDSANGKDTIPTLEGDHFLEDGDFVIKGVKNEFYPCKPDIFQMTYQEI